MKPQIATIIVLSALFATLPLPAADGTSTASGAPAATAAAKKQRIVIQVSDPDPRLWAQAMNYTENLQEGYGKDNVEIEIVALGWGIGILKMDSPQAYRIPDALKRGIRISACEVTMRRQKLTRDDMLPGIGFVPGGLVRIIELQQQGWNYLKG